MKDKSKIPPGTYCYTTQHYDRRTGVLKTNLCPYWSRNPNKPEQENGYCSFLEFGDWEAEGMSLLWDQVKMCCENEED
jgi:hypothetical protein